MKIDEKVKKKKKKNDVNFIYVHLRGDISLCLGPKTVSDEKIGRNIFLNIYQVHGDKKNYFSVRPYHLKMTNVTQITDDDHTSLYHFKIMV